MADIIDGIKQKYIDDIGISFGVFEIITFFIYLVFSYNIFINEQYTTWANISYFSIDKIFIGDKSIIIESRIFEYMISAALTQFTVIFCKISRSKFYNLLYKILDTNSYLNSLRGRYKSIKSDNDAINILTANETKETIISRRKNVSVINGFILISSAMFITSSVGLTRNNDTDIIVFSFSILLYLLLHWLSFKVFAKDIIPLIVLEKVVRGEGIELADVRADD